MFNIVMKEIKQEMKYNGIVLLKYCIQYPQITVERFKNGICKFNEYYKTRACEYEKYLRTELFKAALEDYFNSIKNGYPIHEYEAILKSTITYNKGNIISLYSDKYEYTGGAHGTTVRDSQTWDINEARLIRLCEIFKSCNSCMFVIDILKKINAEIAKQIQEGTNQYFDNYCQLVIENFNENSFYISDCAITIYYQQYDIAPYSSGIPTFNV